MSKVLKESLAQPVLKAYRGKQARRGHKGYRARQVPLVRRGHKALPGQPALKDNKALPETTEYLRQSPPRQSRVARR